MVDLEKIKSLRKVVKKIDDVINFIVLIILLILLFFGIYSVWDSQQVYESASSKHYEIYKPSVEESLTFEELQSINPDVLGWLDVYGTSIDYPIVQGEDNWKYVDTSAKGEYSLSGALFLDYRNNPNFEDYNSIVYGHHMAASAMFGELSDFKGKEYFDSHKYGNLYVNGQEYGIAFFAFLEGDAHDKGIFSPGITSNQDQYLNYLLDESILSREVDGVEDLNLILLSTCTSDITNGRHILVGYITDEVYENPFDDDDKDKKKWSLWDFLSSLHLDQVPLWIWFMILLSLLIIVKKKYQKN